MAKRKKWATQVPNGPMVRHQSERSAYDYLRDLADPSKAGQLVRVFVDEGLGSGWETYDLLDLATLDHPA